MTTHFAPSQQALRDLILLALHNKGGVIESDSGQISMLLRELCEIPDTRKNRGLLSYVLHLMTTAGLVARDMRGTTRRTYKLELAKPLSDSEALHLQDLATANRAALLPAPSAEEQSTQKEETTQDELTTLVTDCKNVYAALQSAATRAVRKTDQGRAAINAAEIFKDLKIRRARRKIIRYYLRELGLARGYDPCTQDRRLFWWTVSDNELVPERLIEIATGRRSYENFANARAAREDTPTERRFAGNTPAILPAHLCSPVTVRRIEPKMPQQPELAEVSIERAAPTQTSDTSSSKANRVAALIEIVTRLESEKETLEVQREADAVAHQETVNQLQERIRGLEAQLAERSETDQLADQLIEKYTTTD